MTRVGVDLGPRQHQKLVLAGKGAGLVQRPEAIVVGEADTVQPEGFRPVYQFVYADKAIIGFGIAMGMQVNKHWRYFKKRIRFCFRFFRLLSYDTTKRNRWRGGSVSRGQISPKR